MENKKTELQASVEKVEKSAKLFLKKAKESVVKAMDQNDDGLFDSKDVSSIAETIGNAAKTTADAIKNSIEAKNREIERKTLRPIFAEDLNDVNFYVSKLIRITEMDKKHAESEVCNGSIGFVSAPKELRIVNIYKGEEKLFGLTFYPDADSELYYVDPSNRSKYIALDDYFNYLKVARVSELQKIAQDLGAKHFRVTYKEQKTTFSGNSVKVNSTAKVPENSATIHAERELAATAVSTVEVAAEMDCPGHAPLEPKLFYLQKEPSIQNLIALRMDENSPLTHQKYTLQLSNSSGIKEKDAIQIDAALKSMKISGNTTVTSEVRNESRRFFEYEIDF